VREPADTTTDSGFYQLLIRVPRRTVIRVGHLGLFSFPPGYYVYTGSAKRGLEARIARHMRFRKKKWWHIDYLAKQALIVGVKRYGIGRSECELSRRVEKLPGSRIIARGFGSSDCNCSAHLFYFEWSPWRNLG